MSVLSPPLILRIYIQHKAVRLPEFGIGFFSDIFCRRFQNSEKIFRGLIFFKLKRQNEIRFCVSNTQIFD